MVQILSTLALVLAAVAAALPSPQHEAYLAPIKYTTEEALGTIEHQYCVTVRPDISLAEFDAHAAKYYACLNKPQVGRTYHELVEGWLIGYYCCHSDEDARPTIEFWGLFDDATIDRVCAPRA